MHPLDLIKTRMQIQTKITTVGSAEIYYDGVLDCFRKMNQKEGLLSFWKGILPPILAETPKRAVKASYMDIEIPYWCLSVYDHAFSFYSFSPSNNTKKCFSLVLVLLHL